MATARPTASCRAWSDRPAPAVRQRPGAGFALALAVPYAILWLALAVDPVDRADWALENALVFLFVPALAWSWRRFRLSRVSYACIALFLVLHAVGAHYTYSEVPYREWLAALTGGPADTASRNHFDRFVHFSYGLLLAYPARELFFRVAQARGFWSYVLPLDVVLATSALFELIEWGAASLFGGDLGAAYLGTQGDEWDAHKDMALAGLGALIAMLATLAVNLRWQRDFAREWWTSLAVKQREPLGEVRLARRLDGR